MSDDILQELSKAAGERHKVAVGDAVLFPEIPDDPPGFDSEANPIYTDDAPHSSSVLLHKKKPKREYIPRARVFVVGPEGNSEYEAILNKGVNGEFVLGRKEIMDLRGRDEFKVYLEWIEMGAKIKEPGKE